MKVWPIHRDEKPRLQRGALVDESKVQGHLREMRHELEKGAVSWLTSRFLRFSIGGTTFTVVLPAIVFGDLNAIVDSSTPLFWVRWLLPTVLSVPAVFAMYRGSRKRIEQGVAPLSAEIQREWDRQTSRGWLRRTLINGALLTAAAGGTVGLMMSTLSPLSELPGESRVLAFLGFLGLTALWTFPMAFGIRAIVMKKHRPFLLESAARKTRRQLL
jgi:hypothetical protein